MPVSADRELASVFTAMELGTVGLDAAAAAISEAQSAVEAASRTANMNRRAFLAARYGTLRADIATLENARRQMVRDLLSRAQNADALGFDLSTDQEDTLDLIDGVEGFRDAAIIDAARQSLAATRATLERVAGSYRDAAGVVADKLIEAGPPANAELGGEDSVTAAPDSTLDGKRSSLGDRLLKGLFGSHAA